jgi:hypothetical protein
MCGRHVHSDNLAIHDSQFRVRKIFPFKFHLSFKRPTTCGSFVQSGFAAMTTVQ